MSVECVQDRKIFGCYIRDRAVDLSFAVESCCCITVSVIVHGGLVDRIVRYDFASVTAYNDQAVCRNIITCILRSKFRIYNRVFCLNFNMRRFFRIFFQKSL